MSRIQVHYRTGVLAEYTIGRTTHRAETSTRPGYHVASWINKSSVDPRSLATYWTPEEAIAEVERRAVASMRADGKVD